MKIQRFLFPSFTAFFMWDFCYIVCPVCLAFFSFMASREWILCQIWVQKIFCSCRKKVFFYFSGCFGRFSLCFRRKWIVLGFYLQQNAGLSCFFFFSFRTGLNREYSVLYWLRQWILVWIWVRKKTFFGRKN